MLAAVAGVVSAAAAQNAAQNIALHRTYRCSVPLLTGWTGLVDGNHQADTAPECFATANVEKFPRYLTVDLGVICTINRVVVYNSGNGNTKKVSLECSLDSKEYTNLRQGFIFPNHSPLALSHKFEPRKARYVRLTMYDAWGDGLGGENCLFLREVEVYGWRPYEKPQRPSDPLAAFKYQPTSVTYPSLRIFRRYCLEKKDAPLRIALLGDSFAGPGEDCNGWAVMVADRLQERYERTPDVFVSVERSFGAADCRVFLDQYKDVEFDLVVLTLGLDAAVSQLPAKEFRSAAEEVVSLLVAETNALVVVVTPPPIAHNEQLRLYETVGGLDTGGYGWQLELVAQMEKLPVMRTGAVLADSSYGVGDLYADNMHLSGRGHEVVAAAGYLLLAGQ